MYSSPPQKANDLFAAISQGIQVPSLWLLSINNGSKGDRNTSIKAEITKSLEEKKLQ